MNENNAEFQKDIREILDFLYKKYIRGNIVTTLSPEEYSKNAIDYLTNKEYIECKKKFGINDGMYDITQKGIEYIKNNYTETPTTSGSNNIIVTGSHNVISDNFNNIIVKVENSDIDNEFKTEIIEFIKDLQATKNDKSTTKYKIKEFVTKIMTATAQGVAIQKLTEFLIMILPFGL